jgi:hypothetical protein
MIFGKTKEEYFWTGDWTDQISFIWLEKFNFWRRPMLHLLPFPMQMNRQTSAVGPYRQNAAMVCMSAIRG